MQATAKCPRILLYLARLNKRGVYILLGINPTHLSQLEAKLSWVEYPISLVSIEYGGAEFDSRQAVSFIRLDGHWDGQRPKN